MDAQFSGEKQNVLHRKTLNQLLLFDVLLKEWVLFLTNFSPISLWEQFQAGVLRSKSHVI